MFEKYTEKARRTIFFARYEVSQLGGHAIGPEHLLLGLLREDESLLPRLLFEQDKSVREVIHQELEEHCRVSTKVSIEVDIPLSDEAKNVLRYATEESERMSHLHIGTEHLLLGLLRVEDSFAADVLQGHGIEYGVALETLKEMYGK